MNNHKMEAKDNIKRYDAFNQSKADMIAYFYKENPAKTANMDGMKKQWEVASLEIVNKDQAKSGEPVTDSNVRYYFSKITGDQYLKLGRDSEEFFASQKELTSFEYSLSNLKVGNTGYVAAVDASTGKVTYCNHKDIIGKDFKSIKSKYFVKSKEYNADYTFYALSPRFEIMGSSLRMVSLAALVFFVVLSLMICYIYMLRKECASKDCGDAVDYIYLRNRWKFSRDIWDKLKVVFIIGGIAIFLITYYTQVMGAYSMQLEKSNVKLQDVEKIVVENQDKLEVLKAEYNEEYAHRAANIAYLIKLDPSLASNAKLKELAKNGQVESIYVFNKKGQVEATNTVYKDFVLSDDKEHQSYVFWDIIKGYKSDIVQEPQIDDTSEHAFIQYVGSARQDAKGMVEIGISPEQLESRLHGASLDYVLDNVAVENKGYLLAIDKESSELTYYPKEVKIGKKAEVVGITDAALVDEYTGFQTIMGKTCFTTCSAMEEQLVYIAVPKSSILRNCLLIAILESLISLIMMIVLAILSFVEKKKDDQGVYSLDDSLDGSAEKACDEDKK